MIAICEPLCKNLSHEKVNSGFIYGLRLTFPEDKILFFADQSHIEAIKRILNHDNVFIENIEYIPIKFSDKESISSFIQYYFLLRKIFTQVTGLGLNKIFFLSFTPQILYIVKTLKQTADFFPLKFSFVLHGDFENIGKADTVAEVNNDTSNLDITLKEKLSKISITDVPKIASFLSKKLFNNTIGIVSNKFGKFFSTKKILLWKHTDDYKYIALAPYIVKNASKYINVEALGMSSVILPTVFVPVTPQPKNDYVKFAIFGLGNPKKLRRILVKLAQRVIEKPYEIKIIGMHNSGLEKFPNVFCPSPGKRLARSEMEKHAIDVDVFLNLYTKSEYRLSCSNSILESLSYMKPILHFDNDCMNFFNRNESPIGFRCDNEDQYVEALADIINNYENYDEKFALFRKNILVLRNQYAIENSVAEIKQSFPW